ncbi:MAG: zf-HC2 domain-containing protein [Gammaproteobacteria bacterium]|nr:zf-HC2 domain-containing protein [Gammaproteobacteria bacterium]MBU1414463.1 zf-HC2 domain-containing protein [Gammaproteobacteria bacterium]
MLTCKEVTHLLSEGQDRKLTVAERVRLEMHFLVCEGCGNFRKQMDFLRAACRRYVGERSRDDDRND